MGVTKGELWAELGLPEQVTVSTPALVWQKRDAVNSRVLLFVWAEKQSRPACSTERSRGRARDRDPRVPGSPLLSGLWLFMTGLLYEILWCPYKTFSFLLTLVQVISISWTWKSPKEQDLTFASDHRFCCLHQELDKLSPAAVHRSNPANQWLGTLLGWL